MTEERKAISFITVCLVVIAAGLFFLRDREPPGVVNRDRMAALQSSIEEWVALHGSPPETLESLGLSEGAIRDHSGSVFHYRVAKDGTVTIITYGANGKPGGHAFNADREITFQPERAVKN